MPELWDIYDEKRMKTGRTVERGKSMAPNEFHIVVNVWIRNPRGEWLISKRSPNKEYPLLWECTGGSALAGEDSLTAALREAKEELGVELTAEDGRLFKSICRASRGWPDFVDAWVFNCDWPIDHIVLQDGETCDAMWATTEKIHEMLDSGEFLPRNLIPYIDELLCNGIIYRTDKQVDIDRLAFLFTEAGWHSKAKDSNRLKKMVDNSDMIITAWDGGLMVGFARCTTDHVFNAQINTVVVDSGYRKRGIGTQMVTSIVMSNPMVTYLLRTEEHNQDFYKSMGFEAADYAFVYKRTE